MKKFKVFMLVITMLFVLCACGKKDMEPDKISQPETAGTTRDVTADNMKMEDIMTERADTADAHVGHETRTEVISGSVPENFVLILGGEFQMGSPEDEAWRSNDETQHTVTVSSFYMNIYELTQAEYQEIMGVNPSSFSGENLPVENVSWLEAIRYCNARSEKEGLAPAYTVDGQTIIWNTSSDGYRLPTEAEWEYACRAGTVTPFHTENSTIIPFCSHGGGRFGQSLTAIAKLVPDAAMGEALSVHYSSGGSLGSDVAQWLEVNGIVEK